jgi:hypothetical protein
MAMIKELLEAIANKYNVTLTYQENHAEFTGFQGKDIFELRFGKVELQMKLQAELSALHIENFKITSGFNPEKITVSWEN